MYATTLEGDSLCFRFRDGREVTKTYHQIKRAGSWTKDQREKFVATLNAKKETRLNVQQSNNNPGIN